MIYKARSSLPGHLRVTFELPAALWASQVHVIGDFNGWSKSATPMHQARDGRWRATVDLPGDRCYEFCYLIDGERRMDSSSDLCAIHRSATNLCLVIGREDGLCPLSAGLAERRSRIEQERVTVQGKFEENQ